MAVANRTLLQLCQEVARNLSAYEANTLTTVNTAAMTCTAYPYKTARTNAGTKTYEGCQLYFTDGQFTPNPVEIAAYAPSTGTFTPGVAWTDGGTDPTTFDIYKKGLNIGEIKQAVNRALRRARYLTVTPLTLVVDGDMEASGITSWGTASGSTFTKVATAGNLFRGTQSAKIANSGANGYLPSAAIAVETNTNYYLEALVRAAVGTAELIAYDATNSAAIDSETYSEASKGRVYFSFTTPATCKSITIRLAGQEATAETYWDNVILFRQGALSMPLPDYVSLPGSVRHVFLRHGDSTHEDQELLTEYFNWDILFDESNPLQKYQLKLFPAITSPVWLEVSRPFSSLATDTATVTIDQDWIETKATVDLLRMVKNRAPGEQSKEWQALYTEYSKKELQYDSWYMPKPIGGKKFASPANVPTMGRF